MTQSVVVSLPFPDKALWPNGRAHWAAKSRAVAKHREWARLAALAAGVKKADPGSRVSLAVTVRPKTRHPIDADNASASLKSYVDGLADTLGVNDRLFDLPTITFGEPVKGGLLNLTLTYRPLSETE